MEVNLDIEAIYRENNALLEGHFLLSSGNHSNFYLQSAKVLENPKVASLLARELARQIEAYGLEVDLVCSPALGGILAGYELARALDVRFIFTERVNGEMMLRRGFEVKQGQKVLICEDIITTGGSAVESSECIKKAGGIVVAFGALANRGICRRTLISGGYSMVESKDSCKIPQDVPLFALADFEFDLYDSSHCPLCKDSVAYKPGSRQ